MVPQHAAEPFPALNLASRTTDFLAALDQSVAQPLVIPLRVKVSEKVGGGLPQRRFAEEDLAIQAFLFQAAHEAFQMGIQIGRTRRRSGRASCGRLIPGVFS
jgi:hypothetical protein